MSHARSPRVTDAPADRVPELVADSTAANAAAELTRLPEVPVDQSEYVAFLSRAGRARTVAELHAIAMEVRASHRGDTDAQRVEDVCQMYAIDMIGTLRCSGTRGAPVRPISIDYTERAYR